MKIGIICALDAELTPFVPHIKNVTTSTTAMLTFYTGHIEDTPVVAVKCGVGKASAAIATQILIGQYGATAVINAGSAGGIDTKLNIFDAVVCTQSANHDAEEGTFSGDTLFVACETLVATAKKAAANLQHNTHFGKMVTGDKFIDDEGRDSIIEKHNPLTVDMETASIAHACHVNAIPYISIRAISDTAATPGMSNFMKNLDRAAVIAKDITVELIGLL